MPTNEIDLLQGTLDMGKKQLAAEESKWKRMSDAIPRIRWPVRQAHSEE